MSTPAEKEEVCAQRTHSYKLLRAEKTVLREQVPSESDLRVPEGTVDKGISTRQKVTRQGHSNSLRSSSGLAVASMRF